MVGLTVDLIRYNTLIWLAMLIALIVSIVAAWASVYRHRTPWLWTPLLLTLVAVTGPFFTGRTMVMLEVITEQEYVHMVRWISPVLWIALALPGMSLLMHIYHGRAGRRRD